MRYELSEQVTDSGSEAHEGGFDGIEATSFGEFARALLLGLGAVLLVSTGTYLAFSGLAATLMALVS